MSAAPAAATGHDRSDQFVSGPVHVRTPASSANLGPGFDALGLALSLYDGIEAEVTGTGLEIEVHGIGADEVPRDETHLVLIAMRATFARLGIEPPGVRLRCHNAIPHGRGLGSSAAAIVGGLVVARALVRDGRHQLNDAEALMLAADIEGHPDNVAAALYGGLTIAWTDPDGARAVTRASGVPVVVFVPPEPVSTQVARGLLPAEVPHAAAARNAGRAALLVAALDGRPDLLLAATEDELHQSFRQPAMPESLALIRELRANGVAAVISGAGPAVLAWDPTLRPQEEWNGLAPRGWECWVLNIDPHGARVVDPPDTQSET